MHLKLVNPIIMLFSTNMGQLSCRFQILRDLIPHSDQKRDKASFLLEVLISLCVCARACTCVVFCGGGVSLFCVNIVEV